MGFSIFPAPVAASGKTKKTQIFTSTGTWVAPTGVETIDIFLVGGGGAGAGGGSSSYRNGGGGGGGAVIERPLTVVPGTTYTVTIGAGGATNSGDSLAPNGSNSTFGALLTANGGGGGGYGGLAGRTNGNASGGGNSSAGSSTHPSGSGGGAGSSPLIPLGTSDTYPPLPLTASPSQGAGGQYGNNGGYGFNTSREFVIPSPGGEGYKGFGGGGGAAGWYEPVPGSAGGGSGARGASIQVLLD
jgi:hypothetical protein